MNNDIKKNLSDLVLTSKDVPDIDFLNAVRGPDNSEYTSNNEKKKTELNKSIFHSEYWRYNNEKFYYKYNKQNFRCDHDFDDIEWGNTVVIVGCSHVFGQGVAAKHTISGILTHEHGINTVNLGIPGASNKQIHINATTVRKKYNPKKVIVVWTYPYRNTWIYDYKDQWLYKNTMPGFDVALNTKMIKEYGLPAKHVEPQCEDTLFDWKLAQYIHCELGTAQYSVSDKFLYHSEDYIGRWLKVDDSEPYILMYSLSIENNQRNHVDLNDPDLYNLLNKYYARDLIYTPDKNSIDLGHWGEQIHRDFADLIVKEHF